MGKLLESETLKQQAAHNTKEQFANSPDLKTEILNAIMGRPRGSHRDEHPGTGAETVRNGIVKTCCSARPSSMNPYASKPPVGRGAVGESGQVHVEGIRRHCRGGHERRRYPRSGGCGARRYAASCALAFSSLSISPATSRTIASIASAPPTFFGSTVTLPPAIRERGGRGGTGLVAPLPFFGALMIRCTFSAVSARLSRHPRRPGRRPQRCCSGFSSLRTS